jgi:hypothetical protein
MSLVDDAHPFGCYICELAFRSEDDLNAHIENDHTEAERVAGHVIEELTPATASRFEVVIIHGDTQGGIGYQQNADHCKNVACFLSASIPGSMARCSFLTANGQTWQYFETYVNGVSEGV